MLIEACNVADSIKDKSVKFIGNFIDFFFINKKDAEMKWKQKPIPPEIVETLKLNVSPVRNHSKKKIASNTKSNARNSSVTNLKKRAPAKKNNNNTSNSRSRKEPATKNNSKIFF